MKRLALCALVSYLVFCAQASGQNIITTVAGNGPSCAVGVLGCGGFSGDGGLATSASADYPYGVAVDASGNIFFADNYNNRIRKVSATGIITTVAGIGPTCAASNNFPSDCGSFSGDGGPGTSAALNGPIGVAVDATGNLYIADTYNRRIREVSAATGIITTVAGNGSGGFSGDGAPATSAALNYPYGVTVDASGNLYVADTTNFRIRKVSAATGIITTVAGNGTNGFSGDGGPATSASMAGPIAIAVDAAGNLYIADGDNERVREVSAATGVIATIPGNGTNGFSGDGGPATMAALGGSAFGIAVNASGNVYIGTGAQRVREVSAATGIITTVAGNGTAAFSGDGGPATSAELYGARGVALDAFGNLIFADAGNNRVREVSSGPLTQPWTQCPPVGGSPSCGLLIVINADGSTSIYAANNPSVPPFDSNAPAGGDDTLVGVQNNSSQTVTSFSVNGGAMDVFGFDGDGICDTSTGYVPSPHPAGCPFGPTGYEGPGVSFTVPGGLTPCGTGSPWMCSATDATAGIVNFSPGIAPGGHAYFGLESAPTAQTVVTTVLPSLSITGGNGSTVNPTGTATFTITLPSAATGPSTGTLSLQFANNAVNAVASDPEVMFVSPSGAAISNPPTFSFAAGQTATLSPPDLAIKAGTVAGTISVAVATFAGAPPLSPVSGTVVVPRSAPQITSIKLANRTSSGFDVCVSGFSTTRDMTGVSYQFTASSTGSLQTTQLTAPSSLISGFTSMYQNLAQSTLTGGQFMLDQNFTLSGGSDAAIASLTVTLTNSSGSVTSSAIPYPGTPAAACN